MLRCCSLPLFGKRDVTLHSQSELPQEESATIVGTTITLPMQGATELPVRPFLLSSGLNFCEKVIQVVMMQSWQAALASRQAR